MSKSYEWDLSELYSGPNDPQLETDLQQAEAAVDAFAERWKGRTDYLEDAAILHEAIKDYEALMRDVGTGSRVSYFLNLSRVIDQLDTGLKGRETVIGERRTSLRNKLTFFELSLGQIDPETQRQLLASLWITPYSVWLRRRFAEAAHDLSVDATNAISLVLPQATDAWDSMVEELLSEQSARVYTGKKLEKVPFNGLPSLLNSANLQVVNEASMAMTRIMRRVAPIAEREINAIVTTKLRLNKHRGYGRPDARSFQHNDLDAAIADSMLQAVEDDFGLSHRFYDLKARLMKRPTFSYAQRALTYGSLPEGYSFEEACTILDRVLKKLEPDFADEFDRALRDGHVDAFPRKGKRGGAACWHNLIEHPTYLLLNYSGQLQDIQTLGHEFGHYLNNLHMQSGGLCDSLTYGATTPMAEVASIFFEKYVLDDVLANADEETRLAIMVSQLEKEMSTIFRQSAATRFEQELYAQIDAEGYLSQQQIGQLFQKHMSAYLGPRVSMKNGASLWWIYWGHFRAEFYNYGYTFAQLVAKAVQTRIDEDPSYIKEFRRLLRTGSSRSTRSLLDSMGLSLSDGSLWKTGLAQFTTSLDEAEQLAKKLGKI